jgi:hypothetical protein
MTGTGTFFTVVMNKNPDNPFQPRSNAGFRNTEQSQIGGTACSAKGSGRVVSIKVSGNGKNKGNNIIFFQTVSGQNLVIEKGRLGLDIISLVKTPGGSPQRIKSFQGSQIPPACLKQGLRIFGGPVRGTIPCGA